MVKHQQNIPGETKYARSQQVKDLEKKPAVGLDQHRAQKNQRKGGLEDAEARLESRFCPFGKK